jgi:hypothetical protein
VAEYHRIEGLDSRIEVWYNNVIKKIQMTRIHYLPNTHYTLCGLSAKRRGATTTTSDVTCPRCRVLLRRLGLLTKEELKGKNEC